MPSPLGRKQLISPLEGQTRKMKEQSPSLLINCRFCLFSMARPRTLKRAGLSPHLRLHEEEMWTFCCLRLLLSACRNHTQLAEEPHPSLNWLVVASGWQAPTFAAAHTCSGKILRTGLKVFWNASLQIFKKVFLISPAVWKALQEWEAVSCAAQWQIITLCRDVCLSPSALTNDGTWG